MSGGGTAWLPMPSALQEQTEPEGVDGPIEQYVRITGWMSN
jgi:hypothetical protein